MLGTLLFFFLKTLGTLLITNVKYMYIINKIKIVGFEKKKGTPRIEVDQIY